MRRIQTLFLLISVLAAPGSILADYEYVVVDTNRWGLIVSNYGMFGNDPVRNIAGGEWPRGSGHKYIFGAGFWIGARFPSDTLVDVGYNPGSGRSEFACGDSMGGEYDSLVRVYIVPDRWPPPISRFPVAPQFRRSDQDAWCCFDDFDTARLESLKQTPRPPRRSMGLQAYQTCHAWACSMAQDFVFLKYMFQNQSADTLRDVYVGIAMDPDIGNAGNDWCRGFHERWFLRSPTDSFYLQNFFCAYSNPEPGWDTTGTVGLAMIRTPAERGATAMKLATLTGGDPLGDGEQYQALAGYSWHLRPPIYQPFDTIDNAPADKRFVMSTGPFDLAPNQTESLVVVLFASPYRPDTNPVLVAQAAFTAESLYLSGYVPVGPPVRGPEPLPDISVRPNPFTRCVRFSVPAEFLSRRTAWFIRDAAGRLVRNLPVVRSQSAGPGSPIVATWDGADDLGRALPAGIYFVRPETSQAGLGLKVVKAN